MAITLPLPRERPGWTLVEDRFEPVRLRSAETLFTVGNGRFATRGSLEEGHPGDAPATLMHGVYAPHPLAVTELANLPDWTSLDVLVCGERFSMASGTVLAYRRSLDLASGMLRRTVRWRSPAGRTLELAFERFVSLADPRIAAVRVAVESVDVTGEVEVHAGLDAHADTDGLAHLEWLGQRVTRGSASLGVGIRGTDLRLGMAMRLRARGRGVRRDAWDVRADPTLVARWTARPGERAAFEKVVAIVAPEAAWDDERGDDPAALAAEALAGYGRQDMDRLAAASAAAWAEDWARSDVVIEGDDEAQLATRHALFQLLAAAPRDGEHASIPAKTLSGFGYRGHVFWDAESFMLPFFTHVHPSIARRLLSYRWHRLDGARRKAAANGYRGAQFPWESADTGDEVTPSWLPHPDGSRLVRIWTGDLEIHVSGVIAHAVMAYWRASGDNGFMRERGAELVLETARFWASRAEWDATERRYRFRDVIGPDEYHDHVDDNAFTNHLAAWHLRAAADVAEWILGVDPAAGDALGTSLAEARELRAVADAIHLPFDEGTGLVEQFRGYFDLADVDLAEHADRTRSMQSLLGIEGVARTQVVKQPDVLMLAHLLPDTFDARTLAANEAYYGRRTDHAYGSSLGPAISAIVATRCGRPDEAYEHFLRAARADLADVRGNSADGIHGASAGGLWQALVFGFAGVRLDGDEVVVEPRLPSHWRRLAFRLVHRGRAVEVDVRREGAVPVVAQMVRDGMVPPQTVRAQTVPEPIRPPAPALLPAATGIRGLIFDLDGVVTDTAEAHYRAWRRLADDEGLPFDRAANEPLRGISRRESLRRLLAGRAVSEAEAAELMDRKNRYYLELVAAMTPADVLPGALDLIEAARARGLGVALGSGSRNAREVLARLGIADRFDVVCDGHSAGPGKPAPDLFLAAAAALDLPPSSCVVFEDAADGVAAARAAGMAVVGIGPVDRVGEADVVLAGGLPGVDLDGLLAAVAGRGEVAA